MRTRQDPAGLDGRTARWAGLRWAGVGWGGVGRWGAHFFLVQCAAGLAAVPTLSSRGRITSVRVRLLPDGRELESMQCLSVSRPFTDSTSADLT